MNKYKNINPNFLLPGQQFNTYLGDKGYTILKSELSVSQQLEIKQMLTIKPYVPGSPITTSFPAFRESDKKLYLPRYFAESLFGPPKQIKISEGENINLEFKGELRPHQVPVVSSYLEQVRNGGSGLLELYCGAGKTDTTIKIIGDIGKKTLIIVNKEFLLNQWIERIKKYYPNARIGRIQGQTIDIEDKDIVLGMLQSLSMKQYPASLFDSFGFTVIDEVHHISAEVFSNALFKVVTKYMIGLSATMDRKDGTTPVIKMFLGEVAYKLERPEDDNLIVRGITFQTNDDEYNELELDFRGKTASAKMLSKITNYNRRSEFILRVLKDMLDENPRQQIMMIASYKNILEYMFNAINHRNIATVGYYVGGMKEAKLKESEDKQVVLATYAMAAEGLDIKTLSTLFMISPMTNVEQAVGRILRQKHDYSPIVVDIIDTHSNFQRQWFKRRKFYKSNNYKIIETNSSSYNPDASKWRVYYNPVNKKLGDDDEEESEEDEDEDEEESENCSSSGKKKHQGCLLLKRKS